MRISVRAKGLDPASAKMKRGPKEVKRGLKDLLEWAAMFTLRETKTLASGPVIRPRTGRTRAGITAKIDAGQGLASVGSKAKHMRQIEFGGPIAPTRKRWLTIPLAPAKTAAGMGKKARDFPGAFFLESAAGAPVLAREKGGTVEALFLLRKRVVQKPRRLFELAWKVVHPEIHARARRDIAALFARGGR